MSGSLHISMADGILLVVPAGVDRGRRRRLREQVAGAVDAVTVRAAIGSVLAQVDSNGPGTPDGDELGSAGSGVLVAAPAGDGMRIDLVGSVPVRCRRDDGSVGAAPTGDWSSVRRDITALEVDLGGHRVVWRPSAVGASGSVASSVAGTTSTTDDAATILPGEVADVTTGDPVDVDGVPAESGSGDEDGIGNGDGHGEGDPAHAASDDRSTGPVTPHDAPPGRSSVAGGTGDPVMGVPAGSVRAVLCPGGHPNPLSMLRCRVCDERIGDPAVRIMPRPVLARLVFRSGRIVEVDRPVVVGRRPSVPDGWVEEPTLVELRGPDEGLSRVHALVVVENWDLLLVDAGSLNGTVLVDGDGTARRLREHDPVPLEPGWSVELGGVDGFRVESVGSTGGDGGSATW